MALIGRKIIKKNPVDKIQSLESLKACRSFYVLTNPLSLKVFLT